MHDAIMNEQTAIPAERLRRILLYIESNGSAQIKELASDQKVSEATIRRDLDELVKIGSIKRTHGGAILNNYGASFEHIYNDKLRIQFEEKVRIGVSAAGMVCDGDTIFLDSGTTTYQIAMNLAAKKNIIVVTYDLAIASSIKLHPTSTLMVTGGMKREGYNVLIGSVTENFIKGLRVDRTFLTADAIDVDFGISNANFYEVGIKKLLIEAASETIVVADRTKFGKKAVAKVCDLSEIDMIVTDIDLPQALLNALSQRGNKIKCV